MNKTVKILSWVFPFLGIGFGILGAFLFTTGAGVSWKYIGNPGSKIMELIGYSGLDFYVKTQSDDTFRFRSSCGFEKIPDPFPWIKAENQPIEIRPPEITRSGLITLPPLFNVIQLYETQVMQIESYCDVKFALSEDGNLWVWNYGVGGMAGITYIFYPFFGLLGGLLVGFFVSACWGNKSS